jgi:hypothetical protein
MNPSGTRSESSSVRGTENKYIISQYGFEDFLSRESLHDYRKKKKLLVNHPVGDFVAVSWLCPAVTSSWHSGKTRAVLVILVTEM